jgi:hypothetical protein
VSFEGYTMRICYQGHLWRSCVYDDLPVCPYCAEEAAWEHLVDETGGQGVEPALTVRRHPPACPTCYQVTGPALYEIPGEA